MIALRVNEKKEPEEWYSHSGCGTYHRGVNLDWVAWAEGELERLNDEPEMRLDIDPGCDVEACQFNWDWVEWAKLEIARLYRLKYPTKLDSLKARMHLLEKALISDKTTKEEAIKIIEERQLVRMEMSRIESMIEECARNLKCG